MEMPELLGQVQSITSGQVEAIDPTRSVAPNAHRRSCLRAPSRASLLLEIGIEPDVNRSLGCWRQ